MLLLVEKWTSPRTFGCSFGNSEKCGYLKWVVVAREREPLFDPSAAEHLVIEVAYRCLAGGDPLDRFSKSHLKSVVGQRGHFRVISLAAVADLYATGK